MEENFQINAISDSLSRIFSPMNFPSDVYKWMKKNAKQKMALKLMKVCKYFQHSDGFPYLVVKEVQRTPTFGDYFLWFLRKLDGKTIESKNVEIISKKFWIVGTIQIFGGTKDVSALLRKTAVCNIQELILCHQQLTFKEFKFLTDGGMVEKCFMFRTTIFLENGEMVPLEDIFECLPNAQEINFRSETPSIFSLEAAEAKLTSKLEKLNLWFSSNAFDPQPLFAFMKNHQKIHYMLGFWGISTKKFEEHIAPSFNKMIQEWSPEYAKPKICVSQCQEKTHVVNNNSDLNPTDSEEFLIKLTETYFYNVKIENAVVTP